jgi:hypothetical protein
LVRVNPVLRVSLQFVDPKGSTELTNWRLYSYVTDRYKLTSSVFSILCKYAEVAIFSLWKAYKLNWNHKLKNRPEET